MSEIAVIIPFYQRKAGILSRAINSVCAQRLAPDDRIEIIVVDDASPLPAREELADCKMPPHVKLTLIDQENGGPGAARNAGLRRVEAEGTTEYVAFLDSDDLWRPNHLSDAVSTLKLGYDFYFCENRRSGMFETYAELVPCLRDSGAAIADRAALLDAEGPVLGFPSNSLNDEFVCHPLCHTSSVVLRRDAAVAQRFDTDLRSAGEDWMYWLNLTFSGARIAISWRTNTEAGEGVNIFFNAFDWDLPATLDRIGCQLLFAEKLRQRVLKNAFQHKAASGIAWKYSRAYGFLLLRGLLFRRKPNFHLLRRVARANPWFVPKIPYYFIAVALDRNEKNKVW
jgi:succinoglycan biosynthesis protein ExoW